MKNYSQKDGMLMIFRAMILTVIALTICFIIYKVCKPKVREIEEPERIERDLSDVVFCTDSNGKIYKIR